MIEQAKYRFHIKSAHMLQAFAGYCGRVMEWAYDQSSECCRKAGDSREKLCGDRFGTVPGERVGKGRWERFGKEFRKRMDEVYEDDVPLD